MKKIKSVIGQVFDNVHTDYHRNKMVRIFKSSPVGAFKVVEKRYYKDCQEYKTIKFASMMGRAARKEMDDMFFKTLGGNREENQREHGPGVMPGSF